MRGKAIGELKTKQCGDKDTWSDVEQVGRAWFDDGVVGPSYADLCGDGEICASDETRGLAKDAIVKALHEPILEFDPSTVSNNERILVSRPERPAWTPERSLALYKQTEAIIFAQSMEEQKIAPLEGCKLCERPRPNIVSCPQCRKLCWCSIGCAQRDAYVCSSECADVRKEKYE